jgi:hypothetical protein
MPEQSEAMRRMWAVALGAAAVAPQLILVWGFEFFPSVDGPAHVHLAHAMYEAIRGDGFYGNVVELNRTISPNLATQSMMLALMALFQPFVAEKVLLSLYFVAFTAAGAYALCSISKNALCLLPLLMFCSVSFPLAFGFYNFAFSTIVFLAWFGYWWRHREMFGLRVVLAHALFALIAYTTHIFAFIVSLLGIGMATLAEISLQVGGDRKDAGIRPRKWLNPLLSHAGPPLLGSVPELFASFYFLFVQRGSGTATGAASLAVAGPGRIVELLIATSFAPYDSLETIAAITFVLVTLFLLVSFLRGGGQLGRSLPFATSFAGFLALYLVMPEQWIVRWMPARLQPLVFIALLLWVAALAPASMKPSRSRMIETCGLALVVLSLVVRLGVFARLDGYYLEYASAAPHIAENSTLIGLRLHNRWQGRPFPAKVDVLIQAASRIASIRHSVDLKNFQGQSGEHPVQFRAEVSATAALGGDREITALPPRVKLMNYEQQTGRPIDYVLIYGFRTEVENRTGLARIDAQLQENYRLIFVSKPRGLIHVYKRNIAGPSAAFGTSCCRAPTT